jgi:hypothetical protein
MADENETSKIVTRVTDISIISTLIMFQCTLKDYDKWCQSLAGFDENAKGTSEI